MGWGGVTFSRRDCVSLNRPGLNLLTDLVLPGHRRRSGGSRPAGRSCERTDTLERRPVMTSGLKARAARVSAATTSTRPRLWPSQRCWSARRCRRWCGNQRVVLGAIVGVLRAAGHTVIATDVNDWIRIDAPYPSASTSRVSRERRLQEENLLWYG